MIGLYYLYKIAYFWFRDFFAIVLVLLVFFSPFYFNSSFNQPKDIPFSSFFIASSYFILRISMLPLQKLKWNVYIFLGICICITNSIRSTGVLLYIILGGLFGLKLFGEWKNVKERKKIMKIGLIIFFLSMGVTTIFFPYLHKSPIRNYIETVFIFSQFPHSMNYYYWAEKINSLYTPRTYIPSFLIIKSPEYILTGLILFPIVFFKSLRFKSPSREFKIFKKIVVTFLLTLTLLIALKPVFYDPRQILFLYPFFYLLLLFPLRVVFKNFLWGKIFISVLLVIGLIYSFHVIRIYHPSQSSYFNLIISLPL